jgi:L-ascorbate metabolism protein UlaG (beta-lactamase superfamily)
MRAAGEGSVSVQYLGGPSAVLDVAGVRLLTDPTFDAAGESPVGDRVLVKTMDGVAGPDQIGRIDAVLLSHDQHPDNLDRAGRGYVARASVVFSTQAAEQRLEGNVRGMSPWETAEIASPTGEAIHVTAVPARHGPVGCEPLVGDVIGFVITGENVPVVYISGDNAALEHVGAVADRYDVDVALLFAGAAQTALLDGAYLTLTSEQAARAAVALGARAVVPLHFEGWAHFSQGRQTLIDAFMAVGLTSRLHLLHPGETRTV